MKIKKLEYKFIGSGEVGGFKFTQLNSNDKAYMYKVETEDNNIHYEIFLKKLSPICIDFEKRIYSETEFKEIYPSAKVFGIWAWNINDYKEAIKKFESL